VFLIVRHWYASATRVEGIEKETASESVRTGRQCCALTNMKNYFVSRDWTPKTREEGNHWVEGKLRKNANVHEKKEVRLGYSTDLVLWRQCVRLHSYTICITISFCLSLGGLFKVRDDDILISLFTF
jgi:hypothetical protein